MLALQVTEPFGERRVGDVITDKDQMKDALATNPASVVRVNLPDPDPEPAKAQARTTSGASNA